MDSDFIQNLYSMVMNESVEYCGNLVTSPSGMLKNDPEIWEGSNEDGRGMCNFKRKTDWFFHTHPSNSKSYPSFEDIMSIAATKRLVSVIATYWGIWIITKREHTIQDRKDPHVKRDYDDVSKLLYAQTKPNKNEVPRSNPYDETVEKAIHEFLTKMNDFLSQICAISFIPWQTIYNYQTNSFQSFSLSFGDKRKSGKKKSKKRKKSTKTKRKSIKK